MASENLSNSAANPEDLIGIPFGFAVNAYDPYAGEYHDLPISLANHRIDTDLAQVAHGKSPETLILQQVLELLRKFLLAGVSRTDLGIALDRFAELASDEEQFRFLVPLDGHVPNVRDAS